MRNVFVAVSVLGLLATGMPGSTSADPATFTVDCSKGQTIMGAVERADLREPLTVVVRGTCTESVRITRDRVTLQGDPGVGGAVSAPDVATDPLVISARGVAILDLVVTGGQNGILALRQSEVVIRGTTIEGAGVNGVRAVGAAVRLNHSPPRPCIVQHSGDSGLRAELGAEVTVNNCQFIANAGQGMIALQNSTLVVNSSVVRDNGSNGLAVVQGSYVLLGSPTITGNGTDPTKEGNGVSLNHGDVSINGGLIGNNRQGGVLATLSSVGLYGGVEITGNEYGVGGYLATTLDIVGGSISNNTGLGVWCNANCTAASQGASINGNGSDGIMLLWGSRLMLMSTPTDATGNGGVGLSCHDGESSVFDLALLNGTTSGCTGF